MIRNISPYNLIILSFIALICVGAALLTLPFATVERCHVTFFEALFTATSAVTVTGLSVVDISSSFTFFGKSVILILIQLGGLGILTFSSVIMIFIAKKIGYYTKRVVAEGLNHEARFDIYSYIKKVVAITLCFEALGAVLLFFSFIGDHNFFTSVFYAIFHSVAAFCNAGISLFPDNLVGYEYSPYTSLVISFLVIFGGLGFIVILDLYRYIKGCKRHISVYSRFVITITLFLLALGTLLFLLFEYNNPLSLKGLNFFEKVLVSFFHSTALRCSGFNTMPMTGLTSATALFCAIFMFIGASPNSTGRGVKTTTIGVLFLGIRTALKNKNYIEFSKRRISWRVFNKASALVFIAMIYVSAMILLMAQFDPEIDIMKIVFELVSAFGTVGLSMGITAELSAASKIILMATMFLGRVGPLTIALALSRESHKGKYKYPKEKILIG